MLKADEYIKNYEEADNATDRGKYNLDLNKLIPDKKDKFNTNSRIFDILKSYICFEKTN